MPITYLQYVNIQNYRKNTNNLLSAGQNGCKKGSYHCRDQLLIIKMLLESSRFNYRDLTTALIDYKKAFDSVAHSWVLNV